MKNVVAYCRSACEEPGTPSSAYGQAQPIRDYAERGGLTLHAVYTDAGVSGVTLERPALQRLIADCRAGKVGTVITKDPERLSRDTSQLIALLHIFVKAGVNVEFSTPAGRDSYAFLKIVLAAVANLEEAKSRSKPNRSKRQ
jgi:site-specific DNA recombinase